MYLAIFENTTREGNLPLVSRDLSVPPPSSAIVIVIAVYTAAIKLQWNHPCALRTIAKCLIGQTISDKASHATPSCMKHNLRAHFWRVIHAAGKMRRNNFKYNILKKKEKNVSYHFAKVCRAQVQLRCAAIWKVRIRGLDISRETYKNS